MQLRLTLAVGLVGLCPLLAAPAPEKASPVLHLTNGDFAQGTLCASADAKMLRWAAPAFARPLEFPLSAVQAVIYPTPPTPVKAAGEYCFELVGDDVLYGKLLAITDDAVEIEAPRIGRAHLVRKQVRRLYPRQAADTVYLGPNGLLDWRDLAAPPQWRDEGGQIVSDRPGAAIRSVFEIPAKAAIEFELSWKTKPDFLFAFGADPPTGAAFQFEVWDNDIVAVGETKRDADVALVQHVGSGEGRVHVQAYLDQEQRHLIVRADNGKPPQTLKIEGKKLAMGKTVRLINKSGDVRLERLRITRWTGLPPREVRADQSRLHRTDGAIV